MQPATISIIVAELIARRLIEETGLSRGVAGAGSTGLQLRCDRFCSVAVRITPSYFAVGLYDINSNCLSAVKTVHPFFADIPDSLDQILAAIRSALSARPDLTPLGAAFAVQGDFRLEDGEVLHPLLFTAGGPGSGRLVSG